MADTAADRSETVAGQRTSLALVLPAFNEEHRLPRSLQRLRSFVDARPHIGTVIVADDASQDGTRAAVERICRDWSRLRIVSLPRHLGKGAAVRAGVLAAPSDAEAVAFTDADLSADIRLLDDLLASLRTADVAIASRALPGAQLVVRESRARELTGKAYGALVQATILRGVPDAHCGLKAYRADVARTLFTRSQLNGVMFDLEILVLATLAGRSIAQFPARWAHDRDSRIGVGPPFALRIARDLMWIKIRHAIWRPLRPRLIDPSAR